jgi:hypothetical protein
MRLRLFLGLLAFSGCLVILLPAPGAAHAPEGQAPIAAAEVEDTAPADAEELRGKTPEERAVVGLRKQFSIKRREQVAAAERIFETPSAERRYSFLKAIMVRLWLG